MISPLSGIYAVIIKHIDRLSPRLQRAVLEKCAKAGIVPVGLSEHSVEEFKGADKLSEEFISEFEPYQILKALSTIISARQTRNTHGALSSRLVPWDVCWDMIGKKISTRCIGLSSVSFLLPRRKRWTFSTCLTG